MMDKKPGLAILVGNALAKKKGKDPDAESEDSEYADEEKADQHLQEIADELVDAVTSKDKVAVKELLQEAFDCMMNK